MPVRLYVCTHLCIYSEPSSSIRWSGGREEAVAYNVLSICVAVYTGGRELMIYARGPYVVPEKNASRDKRLLFFSFFFLPLSPCEISPDAAAVRVVENDFAQPRRLHLSRGGARSIWRQIDCNTPQCRRKRRARVLEKKEFRRTRQ